MVSTDVQTTKGTNGQHSEVNKRPPSDTIVRKTYRGDEDGKIIYPPSLCILNDPDEMWPNKQDRTTV